MKALLRSRDIALLLSELVAEQSEIVPVDYEPSFRHDSLYPWMPKFSNGGRFKESFSLLPFGFDEFAPVVWTEFDPVVWTVAPIGENSLALWGISLFSDNFEKFIEFVKNIFKIRGEERDKLVRSLLNRGTDSLTGKTESRMSGTGARYHDDDEDIPTHCPSYITEDIPMYVRDLKLFQIPMYVRDLKLFPFPPENFSPEFMSLYARAEVMSLMTLRLQQFIDMVHDFLFADVRTQIKKHHFFMIGGSWEVRTLPIELWDHIFELAGMTAPRIGDWNVPRDWCDWRLQDKEDDREDEDREDEDGEVEASEDEGGEDASDASEHEADPFEDEDNGDGSSEYEDDGLEFPNDSDEDDISGGNSEAGSSEYEENGDGLSEYEDDGSGLSEYEDDGVVIANGADDDVMAIDYENSEVDASEHEDSEDASDASAHEADPFEDEDNGDGSSEYEGNEAGSSEYENSGAGSSSSDEEDDGVDSANGAEDNAILYGFF